MVMVLIVAICSQAVLLKVMGISRDARNRPDDFNVVSGGDASLRFLFNGRSLRDGVGWRSLLRALLHMVARIHNVPYFVKLCIVCRIWKKRV
jgi:hypothetical protein